MILEVVYNLFEAASRLFRYPTTGRRTKHPWMNSTLSLITIFGSVEVVSVVEGFKYFILGDK